jgi:hypothetical protein
LAQVASRPAWPPHRNPTLELAVMIGQMSASLGDPRSTTADWHKRSKRTKSGRVPKPPSASGSKTKHGKMPGDEQWKKSAGLVEIDFSAYCQSPHG